MKKNLLILALLFSISLGVMAAEEAVKAPAEAMHAKKSMMFKDLGLNAEQQGKVDAIFEQQHQKSKALHDETAEQIKAVLTPEQFAKFKEKHDKMKAAHGMGGMHHGKQ